MKHLNLIMVVTVGVSAPEGLINYIESITYKIYKEPKDYIIFAPRLDITDFIPIEFPRTELPSVNELDLFVRATKRAKTSEGSDERFERGLEQGVIPPKRVRSSSPEGKESGSKKSRLGD